MVTADEELFHDNEKLKDWFLDYCKMNGGAVVLSKDEYAIIRDAASKQFALQAKEAAQSKEKGIVDKVLEEVYDEMDKVRKERYQDSVEGKIIARAKQLAHEAKCPTIKPFIREAIHREAPADWLRDIYLIYNVTEDDLVEALMKVR
jgi:hypothetical protein